MIELQIGKKDIQLPETLTVGQYQSLQSINNISKEPIEFLAAMTGLEKRDIAYSRKQDIDFVFNFLVNNYLSKQDTTLQTIITVDGTEYGLMTDMKTLNFGGWVDLEYLITDGVDKNIHKLLSIVYRPIIKKTEDGYEIEEYDHDMMEIQSKKFLNAPVDIFWGVSSFFFRLVKESTERIKVSSEREKKMKETKEIAMRRLNRINPIPILSKLYHGFIGLALWSYLRKTLRRWTK